MGLGTGYQELPLLAALPPTAPARTRFSCLSNSPYVAYVAWAPTSLGLQAAVGPASGGGCNETF